MLSNLSVFLTLRSVLFFTLVWEAVSSAPVASHFVPPGPDLILGTTVSVPCYVLPKETVVIEGPVQNALGVWGVKTAIIAPQRILVTPSAWANILASGSLVLAQPTQADGLSIKAGLDGSIALTQPDTWQGQAFVYVTAHHPNGDRTLYGKPRLVPLPGSNPDPSTCHLRVSYPASGPGELKLEVSGSCALWGGQGKVAAHPLSNGDLIFYATCAQ